MTNAATFMGSHAGHILSTQVTSTGSAEGVSAPKKKRKNGQVERNEYGCKSVDYNIQLDTEENLENCILELQTEHKQDAANWNMQKISAEMAKIFKKIHFDLVVTKLDVLESKEKYPFLFYECFLLEYFKELTEISAENALNNFAEVYLGHAYNFFTRQCSSHDNDVMITIDKQLIGAEKELRTKQPKLIAVLLMALMYFHGSVKYDSSNFIMTAEVNNFL